MDACQAYNCKLLDNIQYRTIIQETAADLAHVGYEMLNLGGDHLLISATPEGVLMRDERGRIQRSICNFDLIRKL
jgi:arginase family enzyme